ncbi:MAG: 3-dehydroquinate synthase [Fusobacteriia bacterium 4572_132]|nr:MAG: 3-dehydroquinate synthase [Fusobacteriia bacterium 4572_132]
MDKLRVDLKEKSYDIIIGENIYGELKEYIGKYHKILLISNDKIGPLYSEGIKKELEKIGKVSYYEIPDGEEYKKIETVMPIYDFMLENNFDRNSLVVSLGGGVVCDLSGYVASTFMRGIDFIQLPTSLLAQVDASIGGKVALNLPGGKNLIGSFYQPKLVYIDTSVLQTLDTREIKTGLAEIIKHGVLWDAEYFNFLSENNNKILSLDSETIIKMIKRSCEIKAEIVSKDEKEKGIRAFLNYGHTYGHVVENLTKYKIYRHGEAVVYGMVFAAEIAKELGMVSNDFIEKQNAIFEKFGMDYIIPKYNLEKVLEIFGHDKKVANGEIKFILPEKIGKVKMLSVSEENLTKVYEKIRGKDVKTVIDIGTNSVRLCIAEVFHNKISKIYSKFVEITRLGEDVDKNRYLKKEAIERTIKILSKYKKIGIDFGSIIYRTIATSASRDAENKDAFFEKATKESNLSIEVIDGKNEGELSFAGVMTDGYQENVMVIDIGGGSTEFIFGNNKEIKIVKSINVGAVRLKDKFFQDDIYNEENYKKAEKWIIMQLEEISKMREEKYILIGVAGTITTQVSIAEKMKKYDSQKVHRYNLSIDRINENLKLLSSKTLGERKKVKGLEEKRADVIVAGTFLLKVIMNYLSQKRIIVSENDILEGLLISKK